MFYLMFNQMKKKIFSPLLFMALTLAVSSLFVSCKDYDDDIDSLRLDQTDLLSKLTSLETSVNGQLSSLTASLSSVQTTANDALAKANQAGTDITKLQGSVDEVANTAKKAGEAAAEAKTAAEVANSAAGNAQGTADAAKEAAKVAKEAADAAAAAAQAAMTKANEAFEKAQQAADNSTAVEALNKANSALSQISELNEKIGGLEALKGKVSTLESQIQACASKEALNTLKGQVEAYQKVFDTLFVMATNVELFATWQGRNIFANELDLSLLFGNVAATANFGDDEAYTAASPVAVFNEGDAITPNQGIIIRVNPTNADLLSWSEDGKSAVRSIHFINSKGENLDRFIKVTSIERYEKSGELLSRPAGDDWAATRAGGYTNTGLWKLGIALQEDVDFDAFERACRTDYTNGHEKVLFAVTFCNTYYENSDRYVASTFDLTFDTEAYKPANSLYYTVNDISVSNLKNRVARGNNVMNYAQAENLLTDYDIHEYAWKDKPYAAKSESTIKDDMSDIRVYNDLLKVELNEPFTVKLNEPAAAYYYVVLDKDYAIGSAPSEWVAWNKYAQTMKGLNVVKKADESLDIVISDEEAKGDIVGFRVFAVNCDGTLLDPDGKAFYVQVNNDVVNATVDVDVTARAGGWESYGIAEIPNAAFKDFYGKCDDQFYWKDFEDLYKQNSIDGATIFCALLKSDQKGANGQWQTATNWKDAKYVLVQLNDAARFLDGATFKVVMNAERTNSGVAKLVNQLAINVTKKMPTAEDTPANFKTNQTTLNGTLFTARMTPDNNDWKTLTTNGHLDLTSAVNNLNDTHYTWVFENAKYVGDKVEDYTIGYDATGSYSMVVNRDFVDSKTLHKTTATYTHENISLTKKNMDWVVADYVVTVWEGNTIFGCPLHGLFGDKEVMTYDWDKPANAKITYGATDVTFASTTIKATNQYDNTTYGGTAWYNFVYDKDYRIDNNFFTQQVEAHLYSDIAKEETKDEYFSVEIDRTSGLSFKFIPNSNSTNPTGPVKSTLRITIYDVFGHGRNIDLGFTVNKR